MLLVTVYGEPAISGKFPVTNNLISHPLLGSINIKEMNCDGLANQMLELLKDGYIHNPKVSVTISEKNPFSVAVVGEVQNPGQIQYDPEKTLDLGAAIGLVGGVSIDGDLSLVEVKREDVAISSPMPQSRNMLLSDGDVIVVPRLEPLGTFTISGEIVEPGLVEIPRTQGKKLTIFSAINLAGGPTQAARLSRVEVTRVNKGKPVTIKVDAANLEKVFYVLPGDEIVVKPKLF